MSQRPPAVLVLSSQVARGAVGARGMSFALERFGFPVWLVPTVWLPWHPGHGSCARLVPEQAAFERALAQLSNAPFLGEVGAVLTGYLGAAEQAGPIGALIDALRAVNPECLVVCDPVIGDMRGLYQPADVVEAVRAELLSRATVATPNRFELAALAGIGEPQSNTPLIEAARALGPAQVAVTSALGLMHHATGVLHVGSGPAVMAEHAAFPQAPNGTGDVFAGLLTARLLAGLPAAKALQLATASVFELVARSVKKGADELLLAEEQASLVQPMAMVRMRQLAETKR